MLSQVVWPQQTVDSILSYARNQIYENPNVAIDTAMALFNSPKATVDIKVKALIVISTAYSSKREYEKSLEYSLKALEMLPKIEDTNLKINLLNRIGARYQELKVYDKALTYLDEAYKLLKSLPESTNKLQELGFNNLMRGFIYRDQMSCELALDYFNKAIEAYKEVLIEKDVNSHLSIAYYNQGNCLMTINKPIDAKNSFLQSITYAEKNHSKSLIAFAQKGLASVYTAEGDNNKAINLLVEALQNSEEVGDKILNGAIYEALANNYLAVSDLKNYSLYRSRSVSVNREVIKTERKTIDNSIQNLVEANSKKVDELQTRNTIFRAILIILILGVIAFIIRSIYNSEKTLRSLRAELKF